MKIINFNFGQLNCFVDQNFCDLYEFEKTFCNQVIAQHENLPKILNNAEKVQCLNYYSYCLTIFQDITDLILDFVKQNLDKWEQLLDDFEAKHCNDLMSAPTDQMRCCLYTKVTKIFIDLRNTYELLENLDKVGQECREKKIEDNPAFALFRVLQNNLSILEKLYIHITKLKTSLDLNENALLCMAQRI